SGMQPLLPFLLGETHPEGKRLTDSQKSFRAEDIEEIGDNRHTTFFEMLGNWSLGDYFKAEQVPWMFEFLTEEVRLDPNKLYITCFIGAPEYDIPKDTEAGDLWKKAFEAKGIKADEADIGSDADGYSRGMNPGERIFYYDGSKNWWNRGKTGPATTPVGDPCGPDSEMFYDFGPTTSSGQARHDEKFGKHCHPNCDCGRFMEVGNNVFMAYFKEAEGKFIPLKSKNIDHGSGLERIAAATNNDPDVFHLDVFQKMREKLATFSKEQFTEKDTRRVRVILDHLRGATFLVSDGVEVSNKGQGYVLRRLVRRAMAHARLLNLEAGWVEELVKVVSESYREAYPDLGAKTEAIVIALNTEFEKFSRTLERGFLEFQKLETISGKDAFDLHQSYGFPFELTKELGVEAGKVIDEAEFKSEFEKHQEISRAGQEKKFGGHGLLLDTGEIKARDEKELVVVTRLHTATHMLQQALRDVLGPEVKQAGSDITVERTRFDFTFGRKLTPEEVKKVEERVNEKIVEDLKVQKVVMPKAEAEKTGALFFFKQKYPDPVNVYYMGNDLETAWSKEFCGGPHVTHTAEVLKFKIAKEEAVAAGVRRIRGVVE
ncbi:MAG: alanine--tRNA ligase, partial [Patescibacteria group bacterium]